MVKEASRFSQGTQLARGELKSQKTYAIRTFATFYSAKPSLEWCEVHSWGFFFFLNLKGVMKETMGNKG